MASTATEHAQKCSTVRHEISTLLEKLRVPPELARRSSEHDEAARIEFVSGSEAALKLVREAILRKEIVADEDVEDAIAALSAFACEGGEVKWSTGSLRVHATEAIDDLAACRCSCEGTTVKAREQLVVRHLRKLLRIIHASLRPGTKEALSQSFYSGERWDSTYDLVRAHQLTWLLRQVTHPRLGQQCQIVMPCVLTALDHHSPPIKEQGLQCVLLLATNMDPSELRLYKDVLLDAVREMIVGSDELWPLLVKAAVLLVTRIEGRNPRSPWYNKLLKEMLGELEMRQDDCERAKTWLVQARPLLEAMGLVLVAHFKRLFRLLFYWFRKSDKTTSLEVLSCLRLIITIAWPRVPYHAKRILDELMRVYRGTDDVQTRSAVMETASLLKRCVNCELQN